MHSLESPFNSKNIDQYLDPISSKNKKDVHCSDSVSLIVNFLLSESLWYTVTWTCLCAGPIEISVK